MTAVADYETARLLAREGADDVRAAVAAEADTAPEILYYLASDHAPAVRRAIAANAATPALADRRLVQDADASVRAALGRKLAALAPGLSPAVQDRLDRLSWENLALLVADTAEVVRAAIAEVLQEMPDAPKALILQLARDTAMPVAEPVIRLSPLLTEADLLALVALPPVPATVTAVARRAGLSERLSDAIVARSDPVLTAVLLNNPSAAIRESTLDALIAHAADQAEWQPPLVQRPGLSARSLRALSGIVAAQFWAVLAARPDLDPALAEELRGRVVERLALAPPPPPAAAEPAPLEATDTGPAEPAFHAAALRGDTGAMLSLLAQAAAMPEAAVRQAIGLRSAKALVSLCWKAGFGPGSAVLAQSMLGQLAPGAALQPAPNEGWPLQPVEMEWQLELLMNLGGSAPRALAATPG